MLTNDVFRLFVADNSDLGLEMVQNDQVHLIEIGSRARDFQSI